MPEHETRYVPPYRREDIGRTRWYCLFCRGIAATEAAIKTHVKADHKDIVSVYAQAKQDEHYVQGEQLIPMLDQWKAEMQTQVRAARKALESIDTLEDFLLDAGEVAPAEGWEAA